MATVFTHSLVGAALTPLAPRELPRLPLLAALVLLPIVPDADVLAFSFGIPYAHPLGHRGFTHSLVFAALLGFTCALLFKRWVKPFSWRWLWLGTLLSVACALHGVLDAFTDAGMGVGFFWPFDNTRYFFPWRPLATSPIGIGSFFNAEALGILKNELVWVWLPAGAISFFFHWLRRHKR